MYVAFVTSDGRYQIDQLCEDWLETGPPAQHRRGRRVWRLLPDVLDAITHTVSAAIWFGLTAGYLTVTRQVPHPPQVPALLTRPRQITRTGTSSPPLIISSAVHSAPPNDTRPAPAAARTYSHRPAPPRPV
jgi:hypothetical protein